MTIKKSFKLIIVLITGSLFLSIFSCVELFVPELGAFDSLLIVDGKITNEPGPYQVKLLKSSGIKANTFEGYEGANVIIREEDGAMEVLEEIEPGTYTTNIGGIQGQAGKKYRIEITSPSGQLYQSPYQELLASPEIKDIYAEVENKFFVEDQAEKPGYKFYLDGQIQDGQDESYYLWLGEATYKYKADYPIDVEFVGYFKNFPNRDSLTTCYKTFPVPNVATFSSNTFSGDDVSRIPLHFERADNTVLKIRYSLLVKQYAISEAAYQFWSGIEQQIESDADLYTTQPYQIRGNIKNIDNEEENVLGYFLVAGATEKRIFVDPPVGIVPDDDLCVLDYDGVQWIFWEPPASWPIYLTEGEEGLAIAGGGCLDCTDLGGKLQEPDFWQ